MERCTDWEEIRYVRTICPHCGHNDTYFGKKGKPDTRIRCMMWKCRKFFVLGEQNGKS